MRLVLIVITLEERTINITPQRHIALHLSIALMVLVSAPFYDASLVANATPTPAEISARITVLTGLQPSEIDEMFAAEQALDLVLIPYEVVIPILLEPRTGYLLVRVAATGQWIRVLIDQAEWDSDFRPYLEQQGVTIYAQPNGTIDNLTAAQEAAGFVQGGDAQGTTNANVILYGDPSGPPLGPPAGPIGVPGSIPAEFSVSDNGAAVYRIPIEVPAGTGGLRPNLAVVYNNQRGSGVAGNRFGLQGISVISRCAQTVAQDGQRRGLVRRIVR